MGAHDSWRPSDTDHRGPARGGRRRADVLDGALIRGPRWGGDLSSVLAYARAPRRDTRALPAAGSLNGPTPCLESVLQLRAATLDTFSQEGAGL